MVCLPPPPPPPGRQANPPSAPLISQAHYDSAPLTFARAVAVVGLGTSFGLQASLPLWSMAALYEVPTLAPRERLHLWSRHYTRGAYTVVPLNGM